MFKKMHQTLLIAVLMCFPLLSSAADSFVSWGGGRFAFSFGPSSAMTNRLTAFSTKVPTDGGKLTLQNMAPTLFTYSDGYQQTVGNGSDIRNGSLYVEISHSYCPEIIAARISIDGNWFERGAAGWTSVQPDDAVRFGVPATLISGWDPRWNVDGASTCVAVLQEGLGTLPPGTYTAWVAFQLPFGNSLGVMGPGTFEVR